MKEMKTNSLGVITECISAHVYFPTMIKAYAIVRVGFAKGKWWYGYDCGLKGIGVGCFSNCASPSTGVRRDCFQTAEEAGNESLESMRKQFKEGINDRDAGRRCKKAFEAMQNLHCAFTGGKILIQQKAAKGTKERSELADVVGCAKCGAPYTEGWTRCIDCSGIFCMAHVRDHVCEAKSLQAANKSPALAVSEVTRLENAEEKIQAGLKTFMEVGAALVEIRDGKLYREKYQTFEQYCEERWGMTARNAYRLADAATIAKVLTNGSESVGAQNKAGEQPGPTIAPTSERQLRPLKGLEPAQQNEVWNAAVKNAGGSVPTGKQVEEAKKLKGFDTSSPTLLPDRGGEGGKNATHGSQAIDAKLEVLTDGHQTAPRGGTRPTGPARAVESLVPDPKTEIMELTHKAISSLTDLMNRLHGSGTKSAAHVNQAHMELVKFERELAQSKALGKIQRDHEAKRNDRSLASFGATSRNHSARRPIL